MSTTRKIRGKNGGLPNFVVKSIRRDRNGLFTGSVLAYHEIDADNIINLDWLDPSSAPNIFNLPCGDSSASVEKGICTVVFNYEGANPSYTFKETDITYELDTTMSQDPIETHPKFEALKKKYGWDQTERRFAEFISPQSADTSTPYTGDATAQQVKNPLFGTDSWLTVGVIFRKTWAAIEPPSDILRGIGTIIKSPPNISRFKMPAGAKKRNWLILAPKITDKLNACQIVQEWMLSGPNGWQQDIYGSAQLQDF